jgi:hypothetical protein
MLDFLSGKKTYIVAAGTILYAIGGIFLNHHDVSFAVQLIVDALMGATIRGGVAKIQA